MDFRAATDLLSNGEISQDELIIQILNLPCLYAIFQDNEQIFCLDVTNENDGNELSVPLLYSNLEIAMEAVKLFQTPADWYIAQWTNIEHALKSCLELPIKGVAFDGLPDGDNTLKGLVIDYSSLEELNSLYE